MFELQKAFGIGFLGKFFSEAHFFLIVFKNPNPQCNNIPDKFKMLCISPQKKLQNLSGFIDRTKEIGAGETLRDIALVLSISVHSLRGTSLGPPDCNNGHHSKRVQQTKGTEPGLPDSVPYFYLVIQRAAGEACINIVGDQPDAETPLIAESCGITSKLSPQEIAVVLSSFVDRVIAIRSFLSAP